MTQLQTKTATDLDHVRREINAEIAMQLAVYGVLCVVVALVHLNVFYVGAAFLGASLGFRHLAKKT